MLRSATIPEDAVRVTLPYSEVCMHMRVAGQERWVVPAGLHMAQILNDDGTKFSAPITRGEAGLPYESERPVWASQCSGGCSSSMRRMDGRCSCGRRWPTVMETVR